MRVLDALNQGVRYAKQGGNTPHFSDDPLPESRNSATLPPPFFPFFAPFFCLFYHVNPRKHWG